MDGRGPAPLPEMVRPDMEIGRPRLFLTSRSPRRRQLLAEHGLAHEAEHPGLEDSELKPGTVGPDQWVAALAYMKAVAGRDLLRDRGTRERFLVLGADTTCVKDGKLIGTPQTAQEAKRMIDGLSGGEHEVITGVALLDTRTLQRHMFVDRARVRVGVIPQEEINRYVTSGEWQGKAGGYNLRDRLAAGWPITFEGDPTTIMGLPMTALTSRLTRIASKQGAESWD